MSNKYKYVGVRLRAEADAQMHEISDRKGIPVAVMIRSITMAWLEKQNENPAVGGNLPGATPAADMQQTPNRSGA